MGRKNHNTFLKKQREKKKRKAKEEKRLRKESRKNQPTSGKLKDMLAYLDDEGNIVSEKPEEDPKSSDSEE